MFAIVSYNKNQYKFIPGKEAKIDLISDQNPPAGGQKEIVFSDVLLYSDDKKVMVGEPTVKGVSVKAEILKNGREDKIRVFKFRAKKRYKRTYGQREDYTLIKVLEIKNEK
ncbi:MAG: 50S ribosomal protein L21 [Patescibacteria group bacterium]